MNKIFRSHMPIFMMIIWLLPVSHELNTLDDTMLRNAYIIEMMALAIAFLYEGRLDKKQFQIATAIITILMLSTFFSKIINTYAVTVSFGYLLNYLSFCILINIKSTKLKNSPILDPVFVIVCILLTVIGVLTLLKDPVLETFLKTYYVMHYAHSYVVFWEAGKTVGFFAQHSTSCYLYFIMWWMIDYRMKVKKGKLNFFLIAGMMMNIMMCRSVSALLCIAIIAMYYCFGWAARSTKTDMIKLFVGWAIFGCFIVINFDTLYRILMAPENGVLGRFGKNGNLTETLLYGVKNVIPLGICDLEGSWLTDGGFFVNFMRGGMILLLLYYGGLYRFLKRNIPDKRAMWTLFFGLLAFEAGYQFTMYLRFFMIMLFATAYFGYLYDKDQRSAELVWSVRCTKRDRGEGFGKREGIG